ncbi:MAG TPA: hypothetical protein VI136_09210, partial [Verrucomicrobiae bacterium]
MKNVSGCSGVANPDGEGGQALPALVGAMHQTMLAAGDHDRMTVDPMQRSHGSRLVRDAVQFHHAAQFASESFRGDETINPLG